MNHYNRIKNIILAFLVGFIYYKYIVPSIPFLKELFALAFVCVMMYATLESLDEKVRAKRKAIKKDLP